MIPVMKTINNLVRYISVLEHTLDNLIAINKRIGMV